MEYRKHPIYSNYECSADGTIRHCKHRKPLGKINPNGYIMVVVYKNGKELKNYYGHRLIVETYLGEIPQGKVIDHINGIKTDNRIENLRIVTPSENSTNKHHPNKNRIPRPVIAVTDDDEIEFPSMKSAAKYFDINTATVFRNITGVTKKVFTPKYNARIYFYEPETQEFPTEVSN